MKFKFLFAVAALGLLATGCSNEENPNGPDDQYGKKGPVVFRVSTPATATTRAASGTEDAEAAELTLNEEDGLTVAVFTTGGILEYAGQLDLTLVEDEEDVWETPLLNAVMLPTGSHYFFVFANNDDEEISIESLLDAGEPKVGENLLADWMKEEFDVTFDGNTPSIAVPDEFLLGTLWKEKVTAPNGGSQEEPEYVELEIGRLSSKIVLNEVAEEPADDSKLAGTFGDAQYRLGTVANAMHQGGVVETYEDPFTPNRLVVSAKHEAPYVLEANAFNDEDFVQYYSFSAVDPDNFWFYATENTTALLSDGKVSAQFYGNTTYIQIETVYTPDQSEIYGFEKNVVGNWVMKTVAEINGTTGAWEGNEDNMTFWSYGSGETRVLLASEPTQEQLDAFTIVDDVFEFTDGKNYHKFPVQDQNESAGIYKNRVLRNHYYDFNVTGIMDIGSHTSEVDPTEPIEGETWVRLKVNVGPWDKVTTGEIEL